MATISFQLPFCNTLHDVPTLYWPCGLMIPNTISSFTNLRWIFTGLKIQSYSLPKFITAKGHQPRKISKKERLGNMGKWLMETRRSFRESYLSGVTQDALNSSSNSLGKQVWKIFSPEILTEYSVPKDFIVDWLCRHPLLIKYQNFQLREGKQIFNINHNVYTHSLDTVSHSY